MVRSAAATVEEYVQELAPDRREDVQAVRKLVLDNLPPGYVETMNWGMITYEIPLDRYPDTYNGQPLMYAALASQKRYMSLYLMCVYSHQESRIWFEERFKASGKKLDMGKSCVRFRGWKTCLWTSLPRPSPGPRWRTTSGSMRRPAGGRRTPPGTLLRNAGRLDAADFLLS